MTIKGLTQDGTRFAYIEFEYIITFDIYADSNAFRRGERMKKAGFVMMMVLFSYILVQAREPKGPNPQEHGSFNEGDAIVWYLGHCGYAVRTKNKLLNLYQRT